MNKILDRQMDELCSELKATRKQRDEAMALIENCLASIINVQRASDVASEITVDTCQRNPKCVCLAISCWRATTEHLIDEFRNAGYHWFLNDMKEKQHTEDLKNGRTRPDAKATKTKP